MRVLSALLAFTLAATPALAQQQPPSPQIMALGGMLRESQQREFVERSGRIEAELRAQAAEDKLAALVKADADAKAAAKLAAEKASDPAAPK